MWFDDQVGTPTGLAGKSGRNSDGADKWNMPVIQVTMTEEDGGTTPEQKQALIQRLTQTFVEVMGRGEKTCVVTLQQIPTDQYGIGGRSVAEIRKQG